MIDMKKANRDGWPKSLFLLVGARRFELPTPCTPCEGSEVTVDSPPQITTAPAPRSLSNLSTSTKGRPQDIPRIPVEITMAGVANERRKQPRYLNARLIRIEEVEQICALSRSHIYSAIKLGTFPSPIKTGLRASAWVRQEVEQWVEDRIAQSRRSKPK